MFAQLGCQTGLDNVVTAAKDDGLDGEQIDAVPSVSLGGLPRGVSPLEMAAAYATFAARGVYAEPYAYEPVYPVAPAYGYYGGGYYGTCYTNEGYGRSRPCGAQ